MPLDDSYPQAVVFILGPGTDEQGAELRQPRGTGFIVSIPSEVPEQSYLYVVTAAHGLRSGEQSWIRFNMTEGGIADVEVARWLFHPTEDVAVRPVTLPQGVRWGHVPIRMFVDAWDAKPSLGDRVYFVGLLANIASMAERTVPMGAGLPGGRPGGLRPGRLNAPGGGPRRGPRDRLAEQERGEPDHSLRPSASRLTSAARQPTFELHSQTPTHDAAASGQYTGVTFHALGTPSGRGGCDASVAARPRQSLSTRSRSRRRWKWEQLS
jgi:hypothetical protein